MKLGKPTLPNGYLKSQNKTCAPIFPLYYTLVMNNASNTAAPAMNEYDFDMDKSDFELSLEEQWAYTNDLNDIRQAHKEKDDERH